MMETTSNKGGGEWKGEREGEVEKVVVAVCAVGCFLHVSPLYLTFAAAASHRSRRGRGGNN